MERGKYLIRPGRAPASIRTQKLANERFNRSFRHGDIFHIVGVPDY